jgi:hypothetical protein
MSWSTLAGIVGVLVLVAFVVFAFRQGQSVKPSGNDPGQRNDYT